MNTTRNRPIIKSPCVADRYTSGPRRVAEVHDPTTGLGCLIEVSRNGTSLCVTVCRADDGVIVGAKAISELACALRSILPPDAKQAHPESAYGKAYAALVKAGVC